MLFMRYNLLLKSQVYHLHALDSFLLDDFSVKCLPVSEPVCKMCFSENEFHTMLIRQGDNTVFRPRHFTDRGIADGLLLKLGQKSGNRFDMRPAQRVAGGTDIKTMQKRYIYCLPRYHGQQDAFPV